MAVREGTTIKIIKAPYYKDIVDKLAEGVQQAADEKGDEIILSNFEGLPDLAGALELPLALSFYMQCDGVKEHIEVGSIGIIALGCVIRGETEHFSLICREVFHGLQKVALEHSIPLGTGVLACDNEEQALKRAEKAGRQAFTACHSLLAVKQYPQMQ